MTNHPNKTYMVSELIRALERNHPLHPSTFSTCECKERLGRGGGKCAECLEAELAELIGKPLAWEIHQTIKTYSMLKYAALYGKEDDESKDQKATS